MSQSQIGNTDLISRLNNRLVLHAVRVMQPTFRAEVARKTGLKPATVTSIVNHLIDQQLLREAPGTTDDGSRFGRPPLMLEVNCETKRILAIDFEPDRVRATLTDLRINLLDYREENIDRFETPERIIARILKVSRAILEGVPRRQLLGVGVSLPGLIDQKKGMLLSSTNMPKWKDVPIGPLLQKELRIPVQVERSMHLAALYEKWTHPHLLDRKVVIISLRTGIGMSLLLNGQLYVGMHGLDGEIGHTMVDINGKPCECGSRGCLETFVSAAAITSRGQELISSGRGLALGAAIARGRALMPELIYELAKDGDAECSEIVRDIGRYIGIAIANVINLLAPEEIVICGAIDTTEELLLGAIREQVNVSALPRSRACVVVRGATEKEKLPLLGAAVLIAEELFELPELRHSGMSAPVPAESTLT